jgi:hypothetical protein
VAVLFLMLFSAVAGLLECDVGNDEKWTAGKSRVREDDE